MSHDSGGFGKLLALPSSARTLTDEQWADIKRDVAGIRAPQPIPLATLGIAVMGVATVALAITCAVLLGLLANARAAAQEHGPSLQLGTAACPLPEAGQALLILVLDDGTGPHAACRIVRGRGTL